MSSVASRVRILVATVLAAAVLGAAGPAEAAPRYVALGDSFAAGPLIPVPVPPLGCLKSSNDYAHIVQRRLAFAEFRDMSCSGAETDDMTQSQNVWPRPNRPQFDALTADTALVTLTIGGNDIGFSSIAEDCFRLQPSNGSPCRDQYVVDGRDEISVRIAETAPKVAAVLAGIAQRSPSAEVLVVNYSAIFPHTGPGCWPQMPVAEGDAGWLREKQEELNGMLAAEAADAAAEVVDVYDASRGHDACALPAVRWVEPVVPASPAAPVHPNLIGMREMAGLVVSAATR